MAMQLHGGGGLSDDFPLAARGSTPGRCGWPTAPTRCTAAWSPGSSSAKYSMSRVLVTGAARGLGAALARPSGRAATRCCATDLDAAGSTSRSTSPPTTTGPRPRARRASTGAGSTCWSTTPASPVAAGSTSPPSTSGSGSPRSTSSAWSAASATFVPMFKRQRSGHIVNVASLAGLVHPAGMASLQRGEGRRRRAHRDDRPRARGVRRARERGVPVVLPHRPGRPRCRAPTRRSAR